MGQCKVLLSLEPGASCCHTIERGWCKGNSPLPSQSLWSPAKILQSLQRFVISLHISSHPFAPLCIHLHQPLPIQYVPYVVICCHPIVCSLPILLHSILMLFHILFHILDTFHILAYLSTRPSLGESLEFSLRISLARYACLCCIIFHLITSDFPCKYLSLALDRKVALTAENSPLLDRRSRVQPS